MATPPSGSAGPDHRRSAPGAGGQVAARCSAAGFLVSAGAVRSGRVGRGRAVVRVAIAEDSLLLRDGLVRLLTSAGMEVAAQCGRADELLVGSAPTRRTWSSWTSGCRRRTPTRACGPRCTSARSSPASAVLVLSQYLELGLATRLLGESADGAGYLLKDRVSDVDEFVAAVRRVADRRLGRRPGDRLHGAAPAAPGRPAAAADPAGAGGARADGRGSSNQGIADALTITLRAAEKYVSSIFGKLGVPAGPADPAGCSRCCRCCDPDAARHPAARPSTCPAAAARRTRPCR